MGAVEPNWPGSAGLIRLYVVNTRLCGIKGNCEFIFISLYLWLGGVNFQKLLVNGGADVLQ